MGKEANTIALTILVPSISMINAEGEDRCMYNREDKLLGGFLLVY